MIRCDALIVGGGPAGSACGRALRRAGWHVVIIDRARFPRDKVCAGWITPQVFSLLDLDPASYRDAGLVLQEMTAFRTGLIRGPFVETNYSQIVSYGIRRCEFDDFLLRRSGARVLDGRPLTALRRDGPDWIANDEIRTPMVIGAGGHFCPVARRLRPADAAAPIVAKELEYALDSRRTTVQAGVPELFFCQDLEGYGWCVRKAGFLNVGIGRRTSDDFNGHAHAFAQFLEDSGRAPEAAHLDWRGHAYFAGGVHTPVVADGMLLVGDAAGVAYSESGEGIRPALESSLLAAATLIAAGGATGIDDLQPYQVALGRQHPVSRETPPAWRAIQKPLGRLLLGSRSFTRRVVLDRWFLRAAG